MAQGPENYRILKCLKLDCDLPVEPRAAGAGDLAWEIGEEGGDEGGAFDGGFVEALVPAKAVAVGEEDEGEVAAGDF